MSNKNKGSSFMAQASILAFAAISTRILGFFYKLPIIKMFDETNGLGIYSQGFVIYNIFYIVSSAGLPAAISRMVSSRLALGQNTNAHKVFKISLQFATIVGIIGSLLLYFGADFFANLIGTSEIAPSLVVLAPTVLITSLLSCFRGYFQGMGNSVPTAISQIVEQVFNAVFSILLVYVFFNQGDIILAAAGGNAGTTIGAFAGLLLILLIYLMAKGRIAKKIRKTKNYSVFEAETSILKELIMTAFPIIAGAAIFSFTGLIDASMIMGRIQTAGFTKDQALEFSGLLSSKFNSLTTMPIAISAAMATAVIPSISASVSLNDRRAVGEKTNLALRLSMIISIPAAFGMGIFAEQIYSLIFLGASDGAYLLQVGFIMIIFLALYQITTGILQGIGKVKIPAIAALIGCIVKIPINYYLLAIPEINIIGAVISTLACYVIASPITTYFAFKYTGSKLDFVGVFIKPIFSSIVMSMVCFISYYTIYYIYPSNALALIIAIIIGILAYGLTMIFIKGITERELSAIPMGKKLVKIINWLFGVKSHN